MVVTRKRVIDVVGTASGVLILLLAVTMILRHGLGSGSPTADFAAVGEEVNYLAGAVALMVAEIVRGQVVEHMHFVVFTATAIVLLIFLMRL